MLIIFLIVLALVFFWSTPRWPHSNKWGYYSSGGIGVAAGLLIVLLWIGRI